MMKIPMIIISLCAIIWPQASGAETPRLTPDGRFVIWMATPDNIRNGVKAVREGDISKGIRLLNEALDDPKLSPDYRFTAFNSLCIGYTAIKAYDVAIENCDRALGLRGRDWRVLNNRANAYLGKGDIDRAVKDYLAALKINPGQQTILNNLDLALWRKLHGDGQARQDQET